MINNEFKFFNGIIGQYAEEPDTDEWWHEGEIEDALNEAGMRLREQKIQLVRTILNNRGYTESDDYVFDDEFGVIFHPNNLDRMHSHTIDSIINYHNHMLTRRR